MAKKTLSHKELLWAIALAAILALIAIPLISRARDAWMRTDCPLNLKQIGLALRMYASEDPRELWPPTQGHPPWRGSDAVPTTGCTQGNPDGAIASPFAMAPDMSLLYPDYLNDPHVLLCPAHRPLGENTENPWLMMESESPGSCAYEGYIARPDVSYQYLGYALDSTGGGIVQLKSDFPFPCSSGTFEASLEISGLFGHIMDKALVSSGPKDRRKALQGDIDVDCPSSFEGTITVFRLREGIERFFITYSNGPADSSRYRGEFPVMWERIRVKDGTPTFPHRPAGCNVLFMDGHAEFVPYPSERFPCTIWWVKCQEALDMAMAEGS